jgi:DUF1009 family protein
MVGIRDVAPDILMPEGCISRATPDPAATADIEKGREVLRALGPFDIGQAVVVIDGHVVVVEDIEGTDGLLARVARLRREGRIRAERAWRAGQGARAAGLALISRRSAQEPSRRSGPGPHGIAIIAENTIAADSQAMIEAADRARLFIQGLPA